MANMEQLRSMACKRIRQQIGPQLLDVVVNTLDTFGTHPGKGELDIAEYIAVERGILDAVRISLSDLLVVDIEARLAQSNPQDVEFDGCRDLSELHAQLKG